MPRLPVSLAAALIVTGAFPAQAVPATLDRALFAFPGSPASPASAAAAGTAMAERWLGEQPFDNPALAEWRGVELSPALLHVSRQDLRAANRNFDETAAFFDGAGGWLAAPLGRAVLFAYASQPVLRLEANAFTRGVQAVDPSNPPAVVETETDAREIRAGAGLSWRASGFRVGASGEWSRRDDRYSVRERSGAPLAGTHVVTFAGDGVGFQAGLSLERGRSGSHPLAIGAGVRFEPDLSLSGDDVFTFAINDSTVATPLSAQRASGWEGGVSARYAVGGSFTLLAAVGGRGRQEWSGLGVTAGAGMMWSVAGEFRDPETPWTLRLGLGQEDQELVPESRAGLFALGLGWASEGTRLEIGALRRSIRRDGSPTSYDDRLVGSVGVSF